MSNPEEVPVPRLLDLLSHFISRTDELLGYLAEMEKRRESRDEQILAALQRIAMGLGVSITVPPAGVTVVAPPPTLITPPTAAIPAVISKPEGSLRDYGSVTTTSSYQTVAKIKPGQGKKFKLTKIIVSCSEDVLAKLQWQSADLTPEIYVMAKLPFTDWFAYGFRTKDNKDLEGDGSQLVELKVKFPSGGVAATCNGELSGDEE